MEHATLAGGCFWCLEAAFDLLRGVESVQSGYIGGTVDNPSYRQVCGGNTGHAEAVRVTFDPDVIGYSDLLDVFFTVHDPTQLDRQGADVGTQYRSAIFPETPEQEATARAKIDELSASDIWGQPLVTRIEPFTRFWPAEDYHADYYDRNPDQPYCRIVIDPKIAKLRRSHLDKLSR